MRGGRLGNINEESAVIRLTALWALNESAIGGILHLFRTPFSGLVLASVAITLISLIAYVSTNPSKQILKALTVVIIIKATLSPHSPITAYFAVGFQGLMGAMLFSLFSFRISALLLGIFGLVESVLQKLLTLTLFFGVPLWESIDKFMDYLVSIAGFESSNLGIQGVTVLVGGYLGLYLVVGIIVGLLIGRLPEKLDALMKSGTAIKLKTTNGVAIQGIGKRRLWKSKKFKFFLVIGVIVTLLYFFVPGTQAILSTLFIFLRVTLILVAWYLIISPLLLKVLQYFIKKNESSYSEEIRQAMALMPSFAGLMRHAWSTTSQLGGLKRVKQFLVTGIAYCLIYEEEQ